jgi:hypothetical protein
MRRGTSARLAACQAEEPNRRERCVARRCGCSAMSRSTSSGCASRDFRLLVLGNFVTGLGTQATLVALPYQLYVQTRSPLLTGLLGAVELGPLIAMSLYGSALAGLMRSLWPALALFALAGAADSVSAVCRSTINQAVTPDAMRGRMSAVFSLVVTSGPRFGDIESGAVASLSTPRFSVISGGVGCVLAAALIARAFPALLRYDNDVAEATRIANAPEGAIA